MIIISQVFNSAHKSVTYFLRGTFIESGNEVDLSQI